MGLSVERIFWQCILTFAFDGVKLSSELHQKLNNYEFNIDFSFNFRRIRPTSIRQFEFQLVVVVLLSTIIHGSALILNQWFFKHIMLLGNSLTKCSEENHSLNFCMVNLIDQMRPLFFKGTNWFFLTTKDYLMVLLFLFLIGIPDLAIPNVDQ